MRSRWMGLSLPGLMALSALLLSSGCAEDSLDDAVPRAAAVQAPPTIDPVIENPNDPMWRQSWFPIDNPGRDSTRSATTAIRFLDARPGMAVADLGAGGGYFTFRLAQAVGPTGRVLATDIDARMTRKIAWETQARGVSNVTVVRSTPTDLGLAGQTLDLMLLNDTAVLNDCAGTDQAGAIRQIVRALRPGGRLIYFSATPESTPDNGTACDVPTEEAIRAVLAPWFEVIDEHHISKGYGGLDWDAFVLNLRRRDVPAS